MRKLRTFTVAVLSFVCLLAFSLAVTGISSTKPVAVAEAATTSKDVTYSVLFYNAAGANKGSFVASDGQWPSLKAKNATHLVQYATSATNEARYATLVFSEPIDATEYSAIQLRYNYADFSSNDLSGYPQNASVYKPVTTGGVVSGTERSAEAVATIPAHWFQDSSNGGKTEMNVAIGQETISTDLLKEDDGKVYGVTLHLNNVGAGSHLALFGATAISATPAEPEEPTTQTLDFNLTDAWLEVGGVKQTGVQADTSFFGGDGSTQVAYTGNVLSEPVTVRLGTAYKAADYGTVEISLCISNWTAGNTIITKGYALSDTEFANPLASVTTGWGNVVTTLTLNADDLADGNGNITGFVIVKTNSVAAAKWQIFADYVKFNKIQTETPDMNGTDAWLEVGGVKQTGFQADTSFFGGDGSTQVAYTGNVLSEPVTVRLGTAYKAADYGTVEISLCISNWTAGNTIITKGYALSDTEFANPLASVTTGWGNVVTTLTLNAADLADGDGNITGFVIVKKHSDETKGWQIFADYVKLNVKENKSVTVTDGDSVTEIAVQTGSLISLKTLGATDTAENIVAGYLIDGKLYSENHTLSIIDNVDVQVIRLGFKMRNGAYIRREGKMGLRFTVDVNEQDVNTIVGIVGADGISFGMKITRIDNSKYIEKSADNKITDGGAIIYSGVVTDMPESAYKTDFGAQAYANIAYADGESRVLSIADDNVRSVYTVAVNAVNSGELDEEDSAYLSDLIDKANAAEALPNYDEKKDELALSVAGWLIPSGLNAENVALISEAGINVMHAASAGSTTMKFSTYDETEQANIKLLGDNGVKVYVNTCSKEATAIQKIGLFAADENVLGICYDEPNKEQIDAIAEQIAYFNANANGKNLFVNLFPSIASTVSSDFGGSYKNYIQYYYDTVLSKITSGEKWLSADRYLLTYDSDGNKILDTGWLSDVQAIAEVAEANGLKRNFFIQTMPYGSTGTAAGSRDRVPTYEDIRLQEYALMAFGYDSVSLFCYATPVAGGEFTEEQYAMIDRDGNPTAIYDAVKRANAEILAFDHVLLQFDWQGVFTCEAGQTVSGTASATNASFAKLNRLDLSTISGLKSVNASADTLFGYFKDELGNDGYMVVNYNETSENLSDSVTMSFDAQAYTSAVCYVGGEKTIVGLNDGKLTLNLGAGEGVFVIPFAK